MASYTMFFCTHCTKTYQLHRYHELPVTANAYATTNTTHANTPTNTKMQQIHMRIIFVACSLSVCLSVCMQEGPPTKSTAGLDP